MPLPPRRGKLLAVALLAAAPLLACGEPRGGGAVAEPPAPVVRAAPDSGVVLAGRAAQMDAAGYVEREFFLEGTAQAYVQQGQWDSSGVWEAAPGETAPYVIRILARYPSDAVRFNGIVFVEWFNVSGQTEADPNFSMLHAELLRDGYAYVGVGAQAAGVYGAAGLKNFNPERYADVDHPGDSYSYDIFSQAGRAVRGPQDLAPLGELTGAVRYVIADGESQSASRMVTYVNAVHPLARVYDGFYIHSRSGGSAPLAQDADNQPTMPTPSPARIRGDLDVPVFTIEAEGDVPRFIGARQPDSDLIRTWELAGTAHADRYLLTGGGIGPLAFSCDDESAPELSVPINDGPMTWPMRAALRHLRSWMAGGPPPPSAQPLAMDGDELRRDPDTGIVVGGVRTPHVDVPVRTLNGVRAPAGGPGFCRLCGRTDEWNGDADPWDGGVADPSPTPEPVLSELYPTRDAYLEQFDAAMEQGIADGFLLQADADAMRAEAAAQDWN